MKEQYNSRIKVGIGTVRLSAVVSDSFPLVGNTVRLSSAMKWAQNMRFKTESTAGATVEEDRASISQHEVKDITVGSEGNLKQVVTAHNSISSKEVVKYLYAIEPRMEPYYDLKVTKEIIRTDGETTRIKLYSENGYDFIRPSVVTVKIYRENDYAEPVMTLTNIDFTILATEMTSAEVAINQRGIYDVVIDYTDRDLGLTVSKQLNKLITVTPALSPRPTAEQIVGNDYTTQNTIEYFDTGNVKKRFMDKIYETAPGKYYIEWVMPKGQDETGFYPALDISGYPAGSTLVLKYDPAMNGEKYHMRLLLKGNKDCTVSAENGTPNFTYDEPLIITFDQETPFTIWGVYYSAVNYDRNIRNTVFDGRGYYNLQKGLKIDRFSDDLFYEDSMMLLNGTSEVEIFEVEMCHTGFTAIASKTDPHPDRPWYWFRNFEEKDFILHHSYIHDTSGEGFYLGYFDCATQKKKNSQGVEVEYQPHSMECCRIYRNNFENMGYDGMQLSNARNSEVCYNEIINGGFKNEFSQSSGISIQSITGKIYNNVITNFNGPGLQAGPLGDLAIFNNIINNGKGGGGAIQFLWMVECPEQNPEENGVNNITNILVHNNILMADHICINARNTVQFKKVFIHDNLMTYRGSIVGGQATETMEQWKLQMRGNTIYQYSEITPELLNQLKIADLINNNFQIASDSPMVNYGEGKFFQFDYRGYKNWYSNVFPVGPYLGKYRDPAIYIVPLKLNDIIINEGATETYLPVLTLRFDYTGKASRYRIGLLPDLSDQQWVDLSEVITYALDAIYGLKTIYVQLAGNTEESEVMSKTIEYIYIPSVFTGITINNGETSTIFDKVQVKMNYAIGRPTQYIISETGLFAGIRWHDFSDTVDYLITGQSRDVTLYVKIKKDGVESDVKSALIKYSSTIQYKDITLRIPLSELGDEPNNVNVIIPHLKYGKRFAFSWTMDDSLIFIYSRLFKYINKKWVDDSKIFHDGMTSTTGIMPTRYLGFTDGCGRDIRFGLNSGFISHMNGKSPVLDYDYNGSQYFHLKEMQKFIDYGNGIQNHGAGGYNDQGPTEAVRICNEEVFSKLGFTPFLLLFPGEEDQTAFAEAGGSSLNVYQMSSGKKDSELSLLNLADTFFRNKRSFMNRLTYDTFSLEELKSKADYAYNQNNAFLMNFGGHNIEMDNNKFLDWDTEMMPFLDYLYDTYGKGGNDSIWFAPLDEMYEYLFIRHFSTITVNKDSTDLIINLHLAGMKNFRQKEISLKLTGANFSGVETIGSGDAVLYNLSNNVQPDNSLLVNLSYNENIDLLVEKYVTAFETSPSQDSIEDARYMVSRLREDLTEAYLTRISALDVPFGLKTVSINRGVSETIRPAVNVSIEYNGFITPSNYRLSETADLKDVIWTKFESEVQYTLSQDFGTKTIYCQIKAQDGTVSEMKSDSITLVEAGKKIAKVSLGWNINEIPNSTPGLTIFDSGMTIFNSQSGISLKRTIYDANGEEMGTAVVSSNGIIMVSNSSTAGSITGNNSGIFNDEYLKHNSSVGGNKACKESITFTLPAGQYKVRLLTNTIWDARVIPNEALLYTIVTHIDSVAVTLPETGVQNNTSTMTDPVTTTVGENGLLRVEFGISGTSSTYYYAPLNIIEIEEA